MKDSNHEEVPKEAPPKDAGPLSSKEKLSRDFMASTVVFLVALPLCIGIAVACNVPVERGLIAGIVGGAIGVISGAPLLVSGPAASLIVPCFALVEQYGLVALGPVVMLTGLWQVAAGYLRLGQWFRAVAPAVITGMLTGIGVLFIGSQVLVALDEDPKATFLSNVAAVPFALFETATGSEGHSSAPFWIAVATVGLIVGWTKFRPKLLSIVPGHLVALLSVTAAAYFLELNVRPLNISSNFFAGLGPVSLEDLKFLADPILLGRSAMFAFVASAATLLTANAIDERQNIAKTDYDKEMRAQGIGNFVSGLLGGLPMTGVIVRSSVNVEAGAQTRRSTIFHAIWLLIFVSLAPQLLGLIPKACLGAILVYTGIKLVDVGAMGRLWQQGRAEFLIFGVTFVGVVFVDLFAGILAGLVAAIMKIVWTFSHLEIHQEEGPAPGVVHMHLIGSATFVQLPRLARTLESIPTDKELHVHIERLDHIDHACLQLLSSTQRQRESAGLPGVYVEWQELSDRYRKALVGTGAAEASKASPSIVRMVWAEWKRMHAEVDPQGPDTASRWDDWIPKESIFLGTSVNAINEVLGLAAPRLAAMTGLDADKILEDLTRANDAHVPLGDGVALPHVAVEGITQSQVVLVTTAEPIPVGQEKSDIFFVLLSPKGDTAEHLSTLAHIGRMCHRSPLLEQLRAAPSIDKAAIVLDTLSRMAARGGDLSRAGRSLALVTAEDPAAAHELKKELIEAFAHWVLITDKDHQLLEMLRVLAGNEKAGAVLLCTLEKHEESLLLALLEEAMMPNLVQTLEGTPAIVHGGPFANIAHGCNSVIATRTALGLADYVVTEAGFGADLGAEKFLDIKCRVAGLRPDAAVVVATARALKFHGGVARADLNAENVAALEAGLANLGRHLDNIAKYGVPTVVAVNRFTADTEAELEAIRHFCLARRQPVAICTHWADGGQGTEALARLAAEAADSGRADFKPIYADEPPLRQKIETVAKEIYRADGVDFAAPAAARLEAIEAAGHGALPVCMAKTQYSFSADPALKGAPEGYRIPVREVRLSAGAGFVVAICGDIMTMPGLPSVPAAEAIGLGADGETVGLF